MAHLKVYRGEGAFDRAQQDKDQQIVCGVIEKNGTPAYFLADPEIEPDEVQSTSFYIREGRKMTESEREFIAAVHRHQGRKELM